MSTTHCRVPSSHYGSSGQICVAALLFQTYAAVLSSLISLLLPTQVWLSYRAQVTEFSICDFHSLSPGFYQPDPESRYK